MPPVPRIKNLAQAFGTSGKIRHDDRRLAGAGFAGPDFKTRVPRRVQPPGFQTVDETARRLLRLQAEQELLQAGARTFRFNENALAGIVDPAGQTEFRREAMHKRPKTNPLHRATHGNFQARCWRRIQASHPDGACPQTSRFAIAIQAPVIVRIGTKNPGGIAYPLSHVRRTKKPRHCCRG